MKKRRTRQRHPLPKSLSLRTSPPAGVAIRILLAPHSRMGKTDSHVAALLGMTVFMKIILLCVGAAALPRPPDMLPNSENGRGRAAAPTHTLYFPCRAAPVCAAARHAPHSQRRGTLAPPYRHFIEFVGVGVPTTRTHRTPISLRRAGCPHPAADTRRTRQRPVIARA